MEKILIKKTYKRKKTIKTMEINFDRKKKPKENEICIKKLKKNDLKQID